MTSENPNTNHGKWSKYGVPHKGWTCVGMQDLESPSRTCEMCELATIRYVHVMRHPDYTEDLHCGCKCAGRMEEDKSGAADRESRLKKRLRSRESWPDKKAWRVNEKGNHTISTDEAFVTVFQKNGGWKAAINWHSNAPTTWLPSIYPTAQSAKLAVFDEIVADRFSKALR